MKSFVLSPKCIERLDNLSNVLGVNKSVLVEQAIFQLNEATVGNSLTPQETLAQLKLDAIMRVLNGDDVKFVSDETDALKISLIKKVFES